MLSQEGLANGARNFQLPGGGRGGFFMFVLALAHSFALFLGSTLLLAAVLWVLWERGRYRLLLSYTLLILSTLPWWAFVHWLASGAGWGSEHVAGWSGLHAYLTIGVILVYAGLIVMFSLAGRQDTWQWGTVLWPGILFLVSWVLLGWLKEGAPNSPLLLGDNIPVVWFFSGEAFCTLVLIVWTLWNVKQKFRITLFLALIFTVISGSFFVGCNGTSVPPERPTLPVPSSTFHSEAIRPSSPLFSPIYTPHPTHPPPTPTYTSTPIPSPSPTKPPIPTPTPFPTRPVLLPPVVTPTPLPYVLHPEDILPSGAHLLADTLVPLEWEGAKAAVLVYRWPWQPFDRRTRGMEVHVALVPLHNHVYTPTLGVGNISGLVRVRQVDLNGDGAADVLIEPSASSTDVFEHASLLGWPMVLSQNGLVFKGGPWGSKYPRSPFWLLTLHPVLYYAGPKALHFQDVDGDGLWEADFAYSEEVGSSTWKVDRYRWDPRESVFRYVRTFPQPAEEPVSPSLYRRWVEQLAPLYSSSAWGKARLPVQGVEIQAYSVLHIDVNQDGQSEWLIAYLAHPVYGVPEDRLPNGRVDLALFDSTGRLMWTTAHKNIYEKDTSGILSDLEMRLIWRDLPDGRREILHLLDVHWMGTGAGRQAWGVIYRWDKGGLRGVARFLLASHWRMGAGEAWSLGHSFWPGERGEGWLLKREVRIESIGTPGRERYYTLYWPGAIAYHWDGKTYVPARVIMGERSKRIRPTETLYLVPRLPRSLQVDGHLEDWRMVEYLEDEASTYWALFHGPPQAHLAWDEGSLYVATTVDPGDVLHVALDTDLDGDFDDGQLNEDDYVFLLHVPTGWGCPGRVTLETRPALHDASGIQARIHPTRWRDRCHVEVKIPWNLVKVEPHTLAPTSGYVSGGRRPQEHRTYFPAAGRIFGGAVWTTSTHYQIDDPRTWGTWIITRHD